MKASGVGKLERYFVPDLSPVDRQELRDLRPRYVFVAESPHVNEVEPGKLPERRPLCGAAGRQWWRLLSELLEGSENSDVSLPRMLDFCREHRIAVINAVQYPLDPKITAKCPDADPVQNLGFAKAAGETGFKKRRKGDEVQAALRNLRERLDHPSLAGAEVWALGNDSEWFITQALSPEELKKRWGGKVPHPSAWWRQNGLFGRIAEEKLRVLFAAKPKRKTA